MQAELNHRKEICMVVLLAIAVSWMSNTARQAQAWCQHTERIIGIENSCIRTKTNAPEPKAALHRHH